jgi:4-hydroxy-3-polyprenylbenzoate decarboxylase
MGVVIFPPVPAFYHQPKSIEDIVDQSVMRILDQFSIHLPAGRRWDGNMGTTGSNRHVREKADAFR